MAHSIGEQLKQARLKRGLTLEQVSQATHIRKFYLEALENDQREALPSPVQGRGFLRLYAGHLDLPVAALLDAWDGKPASEPPTTPTAAPTAAPKKSQPPETAGPEPALSSSLPSSPEIETPVPIEPPYEEVETVEPALPVETANETPLEPESSQAIFREIGQDLRKQRESLGLSRAEVERFTRLRQHYVQALEEGRIDQLPSPVQGRGMLSNYVAFLNMDEEKVLLRFAEGLQARRIERIPKPEPGALPAKRRPARQAPFWRRFLTPDLVFGVGVAVIILFFILWTTARISALRTTPAQPKPPDISAVLLTPRGDLTGTPAAPLTPAATAIAGESAGSPAEAPSQTPVNNADATIVVADTPIGGGQASDQNRVVSLTPAPGVPTTTIAPISNDPFRLFIVAHQRAWLKIVTDDKVKFLGRTIPGNAYSFSATRRIELLTGNAAGLEVYYNERNLGTLGSMGQVVGLVFNSAGIATPTPAFTATPTATLPATITPLPTATPKATFTITPYVPKK